MDMPKDKQNSKEPGAEQSESLLTPRAARGDRGRYLAALAQAAPADPPPDDAL